MMKIFDKNLNTSENTPYTDSLNDYINFTAERVEKKLVELNHIDIPIFNKQRRSKRLVVNDWHKFKENYKDNYINFKYTISRKSFFRDRLELVIIFASIHSKNKFVTLEEINDLIRTRLVTRENIFYYLILCTLNDYKEECKTHIPTGKNYLTALVTSQIESTSLQIYGIENEEWSSLYPIFQTENITNQYQKIMNYYMRKFPLKFNEILESKEIKRKLDVSNEAIELFFDWAVKNYDDIIKCDDNYGLRIERKILT